MKIKELIKKLKEVDENAEILLSSDEELNALFKDIELCFLSDVKKYCLFGLSGSEEG